MRGLQEHPRLAAILESGVAAAVEETWTGARGAPETLWGGQTLLASLALGLADVVLEESGDTDVETRFVDEGFGTLDPETLELVLDGLDGLRRGGWSGQAFGARATRLPRSA